VAGDTSFSTYRENPFFWLKLGTFAVVGLLSVGPTIRYGRWRKAVTSDATATPARPEVEAARRRVVTQLAVFPLIPVFAALMARGIGS
jgi:putative membrane protein